MSGLPREILKWMQSLDLSYSVKNVKRDFSNGFLVAEILSRYHKGDSIVSLHSFDNGLGLGRRVQNWALLEKAFKKLNFPIDRNTIDNVIHCKKDAALPLIEQLYTLLTHKTVQSARPPREADPLPPFARPTASQLIHQRMLEGDLAQDSKLDHSVAPTKAAAVLAEHMQKLKLERENEPARFQPRATAAAAAAASAAHGGSMGKSSTRKIHGSEGASFKEVQVRQVDDKGGMLQTRANYPYGSQQSSTPTSPSQSHANPLSLSSYTAATAAAASAASPASPSHAAAGNTGLSALQTLSAALLSLLGGEGSAEGSQLLSVCHQSQKEPIVIFASEVGLAQNGGGGQLPFLSDAHHVSFLLSHLSAMTLPHLVAVSLSNPRDFWHVCSSVLLPLLDALSPSHPAFGPAGSFLAQLGAGLLERDPSVSAALFMDFVFAKWVATMRSNIQKVFPLARIAYAFVPPSAEEHAKVIRATQDALLSGSGGNAAADEQGRRVFYAIVAALAPFEGPVLVAQEFQLLKSYMKLVDQGLQPHTAPSSSSANLVRATALSVLAPLLSNPLLDERVRRKLVDMIEPLIPRAATTTGQGQQQQQRHGRVERVGNGEEEGPDGNEDAGGDEDDDSSPHGSGRPIVVARGLADDEWVIDAELLHVISCALAHPAVMAEEAQEYVAQLHDWAELLLCGAEQVPYATLRAGLAHLTHVLGAQPPIRRMWMNRMIDDDALRTRVLARVSSVSSAPDEPSADLCECFCPSVRSVWHPLTIAQSLADQVRVGGLENLSLGHMEILHAAVEDAFGAAGSADGSAAPSSLPPFPDSEAADWCHLFHSLRDHLTVELCDPALCDMVTDILRHFLLDARTSHAAQTIFLPVTSRDGAESAASAAAPPLYYLMRYMFPSAASSSQTCLSRFLTDMAARPHLVGPIHKMIEVFAEAEADKFAASPLGTLLAKLNEQRAQASGQ